MEHPCRYGIGKSIALRFDLAVAKVVAMLEAKGFRILFRVDMGEFLSRSGSGDARPYLILGACKPDLARRAYAADRNVGLLLPCKVAIYEEGAGRCRVMAMDPAWLMDLVRAPEVIEVAIAVKEEVEDLVEQL
jgi:uncharacterized protein (DUF302 family)